MTSHTSNSTNEIPEFEMKKSEDIFLLKKKKQIKIQITRSFLVNQGSTYSLISKINQVSWVERIIFHFLYFRPIRFGF